MKSKKRAGFAVCIISALCMMIITMTGCENNVNKNDRLGDYIPESEIDYSKPVQI